MELRDLTFDKCRYKPTSKTFVRTISSAIPEFAAYEGKNKKQVFQYVVSLYDKHSPLWVKEPEYFPRKVLAANLCRLSEETNGGSLSGFTREVIEGRHEDVNALVTAYLADTGDVEYTMLITELNMYHKLFQQQAGGTLLDDRQYKMMKEIMSNIQERTRRIFGSGQDEELTRVKNLLYERAEQDRQKLNPEAVVKMIERDGDVPQDWSPYSTKYKVEPLKFYEDDPPGQTS